MTPTGPEPAWLNAVRQGSFAAIPQPFTFSQSLHFAHLINGYQFCDSMGWPTLRTWALDRSAVAARSGIWRGTALELWCCLFYEHRRYRPPREGVATGAELEWLDRLCATLRTKLQFVSDVERRLLLDFIAAARRSVTAPPWP